MKPKFKIMQRVNSNKVFNFTMDSCGWYLIKNKDGSDKDFNTLEEAHQEIINIITNKDISISNLKIIQEFPFAVQIVDKLDTTCTNCTRCNPDCFGEVHYLDDDCDLEEDEDELGPCVKCISKSCDGCEHDANPEQLKELDEIDIDLINDGIDDVDG